MSAKREPSPSLPDGLLAAIGKGDEDKGLAYLRNRPSFARLAQRLKANGWPGTLTREDFALLYQPIRTRKTLERITQLDPTMRLVDQTINAWSQTPGGQVQVKARYVPPPEPAKPALTPAKPRPIVVSERRPKGSGMRLLLIPDCHVGHREADEGELVPLHDRRAMACYLEVARGFVPQIVIVLGDLLDLAAFGKYLVDPTMKNVAQFAIQEAHDFLAELREATPKARIVYIEGNHEVRIRNHLRMASPEATYLARANETEPVLSVPYLLRLADLRIEYVGEYQRHLWIDGIRIMHGHLVGSKGGLTAAKMLDAYDGSAVCGHTHRLEVAYRTVHTSDGPRLQWAMSCGTGARLDSVVPGSHYPDWQQGFGVVWDGGQPSVHTITDGATWIDGRIYAAQETADEDEGDGESQTSTSS